MIEFLQRGDCYTKEEIDARIAPRPPVLIPTFCSLFGPEHWNGGLNGPFGTDWAFPGPVSCSTKQFEFQLGLCPAVLCRWLLVWVPRYPQVRARLIACTGITGAQPSSDMVVLAEIASTGNPNPEPREAHFTAQFNALVQAKVGKILAFQVLDDGVNYPTLQESRLEITYAF